MTVPVAIEEVSVDSSARILVRPKDPPYEHYDQIYRADAGVEWSRESRAFFPYEIKGMSHSWWFSTILAAVQNEYGEMLELRPETRWTNVPADARRDIEAKHAV